MKISENIRVLAQEGLSTAEIARRLNIRYQHAYNVLKRDGPVPVASRPVSAALHGSGGPAERSKPRLKADHLIASGFTHSGRWVLSPSGQLVADRSLPKAVGVYAFAKSEVVLYIGVATMGLSKRLHFYAKPGTTQRTSQRLNTIIKNELQATPCIDIYTATPPDLEWNGLPIHGSAGLELGLIRKYALPWNMRSAG